MGRRLGLALQPEVHIKTLLLTCCHSVFKYLLLGLLVNITSITCNQQKPSAVTIIASNANNADEVSPLSSPGIQTNYNRAHPPNSQAAPEPKKEDHKKMMALKAELKARPSSDKTAENSSIGCTRQGIERRNRKRDSTMYQLKT